MIDIESDELIALAHLPARLPKTNKGKKPHYSTIHRWTTTGLHGAVLETVRIGGTAYTTMRAVREFSEARGRKKAKGPVVDPTAASIRAISALNKMGF